MRIFSPLSIAAPDFWSRKFSLGALARRGNNRAWLAFAHLRVLLDPTAKDTYKSSVSPASAEAAAKPPAEARAA
jgi:hypothetical protein